MACLLDARKLGREATKGVLRPRVSRLHLVFSQVLLQSVTKIKVRFTIRNENSWARRSPSLRHVRTDQKQNQPQVHRCELREGS